MRINYSILILFLYFPALFASNQTRNKDSIAQRSIYNHIDTTCIESCRNKLTVKLLLVSRFNSFSIKDKLTNRTLEYSINSKTSLGFGLSYKGIGIEFQLTPKAFGNNKDDFKYGSTRMFSISTSANSRRFIYDVYLRASQGFHTTEGFKVAGDTSNLLIYLYRPDISNISLGTEVVYIFNNKHFSSSAPYNYSQRQRRGAGSALLGSLFSLYAVNADSIIFPDSLKNRFAAEVQFKDAGSYAWGFSFGYTYTFVFGRKKNWYANIYTLPGLAVQQYYATNVYSEQTKSRVSLGIPFQFRCSIGVNCKNYYWGFSALSNNYTINTDKGADFSYKYGCLRFCYGYRFGLKKEYFTKFLK